MKYFLIIYAMVNNSPTPVVVTSFDKYSTCHVAKTAMMFSFEKQKPEIEVISSECVKVFQL